MLSCNFESFLATLSTPEELLLCPQSNWRKAIKTSKGMVLQGTVRVGYRLTWLPHRIIVEVGEAVKFKEIGENILNVHNSCRFLNPLFLGTRFGLYWMFKEGIPWLHRVLSNMAISDKEVASMWSIHRSHFLQVNNHSCLGICSNSGRSSTTTWRGQPNRWSWASCFFSVSPTSQGGCPKDKNEKSENYIV